MVEPKPPLRAPLVLIASGQEWAARSLESVLSPRGYAVVRVNNARQLSARVQEASPDAVIIDDTLPDLSATAACEIVRSDSDAGAGTPVLITAPAPWPQEQRMVALAAGAWEVFAGGVAAEELLVRLHTYTAAKLEADRARENSLIDPETGFYNRWGLLRRLAELAAAASRFGRALGCVVIEPDSAILDSQSAEQLAKVLRTVARMVRAATRLPDALGRTSRTKVTVIAADSGQAGAACLAERLIRSPLYAPHVDPVITVRAGYYATDNFQTAGIDSVELLARANAALQAAQDSGSPFGTSQ